MFKVIVLLALVAIAAAQTQVNVRPCPGHTAPHFFESHDCSADRCRLIRGQIFTGVGEWTTHRAFSSLQVQIQATLFGLPLDMPLTEEEANACLTTVGGCPIAAGSRNRWTLHFFVEALLPQNVAVVIMSEFTIFAKKIFLS